MPPVTPHRPCIHNSLQQFVQAISRVDLNPTSRDNDGNLQIRLPVLDLPTILGFGGFMNRNSKWIVSCCLVTLLAISAAAQSNKSGVVILNGGSRAIFVKPPIRVQTPPPLPKGVVIYSNLGKGDQAYNPNSGVGIVGPNAGQLFSQWVGIPFTPKGDHLVQAIQVAATYVSGTNQMGLLLDADDNGVPGKTLHAWELSNLPDFGACCPLQTSVYKAGVPVKGGTQYWVVLRTTPSGTDTYGVWDDNFAGTEGTWANNTGQGWSSSYQVLAAMGVYGQ